MGEYGAGRGFIHIRRRQGMLYHVSPNKLRTRRDIVKKTRTLLWKKPSRPLLSMHNLVFSRHGGLRFIRSAAGRPVGPQPAGILDWRPFFYSLPALLFGLLNNCYDTRGCPWQWRRESLKMPHGSSSGIFYSFTDCCG